MPTERRQINDRGYHRQLMTEWPTDKAIFIPDSLVPPSMKSWPRRR